MPAKVIWAPSSLTDVGDIVAYIAADNISAALRVGQEIVDAVDRLSPFPQLGRVMREETKPDLREFTVGNYRIIYRFIDSNQTVIVLRIWHGARGRPTAPPS